MLTLTGHVFHIPTCPGLFQSRNSPILEQSICVPIFHYNVMVPFYKRKITFLLWNTLHMLIELWNTLYPAKMHQYITAFLQQATLSD